MRGSAFYVVANIKGYMGNATLLEFGYAVALGIQILSIEPIKDPHLAVYSRYFGEVFPDWPDWNEKKAMILDQTSRPQTD